MSNKTKKHEHAPLPQPAPQPAIPPRVLAGLVLEAVRGDPDSLDAIVANTKEFLFGAAGRFLEEREYSRAVWQTVRLSAVGEPAALRPKGSPMPWAWKIGQCTGFLEEAPQGAIVMAMAGIGATLDSQFPNSQCLADTEEGQLAAQRECRGVVQGALGALSKRERSVVELCCLEGLSSKEAATVLGISAHAIRNCLVSAKGRMELFFADIETSKGGVK
jgi:DNA-directed RNA polymerase specialized sigma24 family protein